MMFNQYAAGIQMKTYHNGNWEDKTPAHHIKGTDARTDVLDDR